MEGRIDFQAVLVDHWTPSENSKALQGYEENIARKESGACFLSHERWISFLKPPFKTLSVECDETSKGRRV